ncbi:MAG: outer membrane beta-barrel protein [Bacteroidales bacterium]|nr:outer membrane beta-barrel protein [Bacteroidales bacterium]
MKKLVALLCLFAIVIGGLPTANAQSNKKKKEKFFENVVEKADQWGIGEKIPGWSLIRAKATGKKTLMGLTFGYGNLGLTDFTIPERTDALGSPLLNDNTTFDGGTQWSIRLKVIFYRNKQFSIHTGIGYESNIFKFKDVSFANSVSPGITTEEKLVARYITVPLQLKYKLAKSFSVHGGVIGGLNFNTSHTGDKYLWTIEDTDYTARKEFKDFNPFRLDAQVGLTLYHVTFYFKYGLLDTFKGDDTFSAHAMSWGISLGI